MNKYLWLILSCSILGNLSFAQIQFNKVYTKDLEVSPSTTIVTKGPRNFSINMHGTMTMDDTDYAFSISGRNEYPVLVIVKSLVVETWDKDIVRQEVSLDVQAKTKEDVTRLENELAITIVESASGEVAIDCNMNIERFRMKNGLFIGDQCWLELENGKTLDLVSLEIQTKLYIPKTSNFRLNGEYADLKIGELDGALHLNLSDGSLDAKKLNELYINAVSCELHLGEIQNATINAKSSKIKATKIQTLVINENENPGKDMDVWLSHDELNSSALNKFDLKQVNYLEILNSENDQFTINEIDEMRVSNSIFSNFSINKLNKSLKINSKSGDLIIYDIDPGFENIDINSQISTISLNLNALPNYNLIIPKNEQLTYNSPIGVASHNKTSWKDSYVKGSQDGGNVEINCSRCKLKFD